MSSIEYTRGDVTLKRHSVGTGSTGSRWHFVIANQHDEAAEPQEFVITKPVTVEDLKALIGQVEHAAKVLSGERER